MKDRSNRIAGRKLQNKNKFSTQLNNDLKEIFGEFNECRTLLRKFHQKNSEDEVAILYLKAYYDLNQQDKQKDIILFFIKNEKEEVLKKILVTSQNY